MLPFSEWGCLNNPKQPRGLATEFLNSKYSATVNRLTVIIVREIGNKMSLGKSGMACVDFHLFA